MSTNDVKHRAIVMAAFAMILALCFGSTGGGCGLRKVNGAWVMGSVDNPIDVYNPRRTEYTDCFQVHQDTFLSGDAFTSVGATAEDKARYNYRRGLGPTQRPAYYGRRHR